MDAFKLAMKDIRLCLDQGRIDLAYGLAARPLSDWEKGGPLHKLPYRNRMPKPHSSLDERQAKGDA